MIKEFSIENVRCFKGKQTVNIRPITFLIGENSTGKTTLLGCLQALLGAISHSRPATEGIDFNNPPYDMGTFVDIVRRNTPKINTFQLEFKWNAGKEQILFHTFHFIENREGTEPVLDEVIIELRDNEKIIFRIILNQAKQTAERGQRFGVVNILKRRGNIFVLDLEKMFFERGIVFISDIYVLHRATQLSIKSQKKTPSKSMRDFASLIEPFKNILSGEIINKKIYNKMYSFAPVRSKPKRVYVPIKETEDPEGSHIYMHLNNIYQTERWTGLQEKLNEFGKQSGMFDDIDVRRLGEHKTDPFQIQTTIRGQKNNIIDVGYGISQILPMLVTILQTKDEIGIFAIQQPEVHLHPKAQAALSSLLINIAKEQEKSFIVETHSDAMVDRARIEVMKGTIAPEDVSIVYLEPKDGEVKIHNITMDDQGNLEHVPQGYRDFFTKETDSLLGWS